MRPYLRWNRIPAVLAFALLALQAAAPWSGRYFMTMDGPSHLYTAHVAREILLGNSAYQFFYQLQPAAFTNWGMVLCFNLASFLVTPAHAEKAVFTLCVVLAFVGFSCLVRSLHPSRAPFSPAINFLASVWFLWIGFYNYYLGVVLYAISVGYYISNSGKWRWRSAAALALALLAAYATHPVPAALAVLTMAIVGAWTRGGEWLRGTAKLSELGREFACLSAAAAPVAGLIAWFASQSYTPAEFHPRVQWAWESFPMHVFATAAGRSGGQLLLYPAMLIYMLAAVLAMRKAEWKSARGGMVAAAAVVFGLYLFTPDAGFGGNEVKIRLAWVVFVLGGATAVTVARLRAFLAPLSVVMTLFLAAHWINAMQLNVRRVSAAVAEYARVTGAIPQGSVVIRRRFPTEAFARDFGFSQIAVEPLFHADSWVAARRGLVAISDYQPLSKLFPVALRPSVSEPQRFQLWDLEGAPAAAASLRALLREFPRPVDRLIVLGDNSMEGEAFDSLIRELDSQMRLAATDSRASFLRLYQRR